MMERIYHGLMDILARAHYGLARPVLRLRPLEQRLIAEVMNALPVEAAEILQKQIEHYNLVQRDGNRQKSVFYRIERGTHAFPGELRFPRQARDAKFARVTFTIPRHAAPYHATFHAYKGRLFQIAFDRSVRDVLESTDVTIERSRVMPAEIMGP